MEDAERFISCAVKVGIRDVIGETGDPWLCKTIHSISLCPDHTHMRIYFDRHTFLAVPLTSRVEQTDQEWCAYDEDTGLYYYIRNGESDNE